MNSHAGKPLRSKLKMFSHYPITELAKSKRNKIESILFYNRDLPYYTIHNPIYFTLKHLENLYD